MQQCLATILWPRLASSLVDSDQPPCWRFRVCFTSLPECIIESAIPQWKSGDWLFKSQLVDFGVSWPRGPSRNVSTLSMHCRYYSAFHQGCVTTFCRLFNVKLAIQRNMTSWPSAPRNGTKVETCNIASCDRDLTKPLIANPQHQTRQVSELFSGGYSKKSAWRWWRTPQILREL